MKLVEDFVQATSYLGIISKLLEFHFSASAIINLKHGSMKAHANHGFSVRGSHDWHDHEASNVESTTLTTHREGATGVCPVRKARYGMRDREAQLVKRKEAGTTFRGNEEAPRPITQMEKARTTLLVAEGTTQIAERGRHHLRIRDEEGTTRYPRSGKSGPLRHEGRSSLAR